MIFPISQKAREQSPHQNLVLTPFQGSSVVMPQITEQKSKVSEFDIMFIEPALNPFRFRLFPRILMQFEVGPGI